MSLPPLDLAPGPGRWLLRGVAGSGKTAALVAQALRLRAEHRAWRILFLCFNASLASELRRQLPGDPRTEVATFHDWAQSLLAAYGVPIPPPPGRGVEWDRYWTQDMPRLLLRAFEDGRLPARSYQAVLVDEGQDFAGDWYRALLHALDPATDTLTIAVDEAQNIYRRKIDWRDIGFDGQTRWLGTNRRTPPPIFAAACRLIRDLPDPLASPSAAARQASLRSDPLPDPLASPSAAARQASLATGDRPPAIMRCDSFDRSREHALGWIRERVARGVPPGDILLLGVSRLDMITVNAWLNSKGIAAWLPAETERAQGVRVSTIHGAKGLDADSVLLIDAHHLETRDGDEARRLLYIAMTRARRDLCISYFRDTPLMDDLVRACAS